MDNLQTFDIPREQPLTLDKETLAREEVAPPQAPTESQWRRVLGVILVESEIRYLVERGE